MPEITLKTDHVIGQEYEYDSFMMDPSMASEPLGSSGPLELDQLQIDFSGNSSEQQLLDINVNENRQTVSIDIDNQLNGGVTFNECQDNNNIVDETRRGVQFLSLESPDSVSETLNGNIVNIADVEEGLSYEDEPEEVRMVIDELVEESIAAGLAIFVDEQNRKNHQNNPVKSDYDKAPMKDGGSPRHKNVGFQEPVPPVIISPSSEDNSEDKSDFSSESELDVPKEDSDAEFEFEIPVPPISIGGKKVDVSDDSSRVAASSSVPETRNTNDKAGSSDTTLVVCNTDQTNSMDEAQAIWDSVQTVEPGFAGVKELSSKKQEDSPLLNYSSTVHHLEGLDYSEVKGNIKMQIERTGLSALAHFIFGPPKLHRDLLPEKEFVFCIAASPLNNSDNCHMSILQTIYRCLTGSRFNCPRYGSHWEEIGFQGNDPATDVRGTGMFGLLQLVHFLKDPKKSKLARDIYKLSLDTTQNFPFCIVGLNMSRFTLQALREDLLNKDCNKHGSVMDVVNDFYTGIFLHLYRLWKQGKTMSDSGPVLRDVEQFSKKHPKDVMKNLQDYLSIQKAEVNTVLGAGEPFLNVCSVDKEEE